MRLAVFGSTGSIGGQALEVARAHPDRMRVTALAAGKRADLLIPQVVELRPEAVAVADPLAGAEVRSMVGHLARVEIGPDAVAALAADACCDTQVHAITGIAGLRPMLAGLAAGAHVAFATKEPLVAAGELVLRECARHGGRLAPIDSEISALWQCIGPERSWTESPSHVRRILLTASGGPFRTWPAERIRSATLAQALDHPTWRMGAKITIDSASLMNKGLEVVEASRFFGVPAERIEVIVHPQSVVHSMVEFDDGSTLAQLGRPDMRLPIQYALLAPDRPEGQWDRLDWREIGRLDFEPVDLTRSPCLRLAYESLRAGGTATTVLNAANEVANAAFQAERIAFGAIAASVEYALERHLVRAADTLDEVEDADGEGRRLAAEFMGCDMR